MKHLINLIVFITILGCSSVVDVPTETDHYSFSLVEITELELRRDRLQTVHRLTGTLHKNNGQIDRRKKLGWESSHSWVLTDTLGYVVRRTINANGEWAVLDTITVTGFDGFEVPTVNPVSITRDDGEFSGMIAPILPMRGETMTVKIYYRDVGVYEWDTFTIKLK